MYNEPIPDNSRAAISEAYDAALIRAAFQRMEVDDMKKYRQCANMRPDPDKLRHFRRRMARRRAGAALAREIPKWLRASACLIGVLSIGAGVALAASPALRNWAAGTLRAEIYRDDGGNWFPQGSDPVATEYSESGALSGFRDGAVIGDALYLAGGVNSDEDIYVQRLGESAPQRYHWRNRGERTLMEICARGDALYALFGLPNPDNENFVNMRAYGIGEIALNADNSFELTPIIEFTNAASLRGDARETQAESLRNFTSDGEIFYFIAEWQFDTSSFSSAVYASVICASDGELRECARLNGEWGDSAALFGGAGSKVYLARVQNGADTQIAPLSPGGLGAVIAEIPSAGFAQPFGFAVRPADSALVYAIDGGIYAAPDFDPARAAYLMPIAHTDGEGFWLEPNGYAIVNRSAAQIYDLESTPASADALRVHARGNVQNARFSEIHPDVRVSADAELENAIRKLNGPRLASEAILGGHAQADLWIVDAQDALQLMRNGRCAPLASAELRAWASALPEDIRRAVAPDDAPLAVPLSVNAQADLSLSAEALRAIGMGDHARPESWAELFALLDAISKSGRAQDLPLFDTAPTDYFESTGADALPPHIAMRALMLRYMTSAYLRLCNFEGRAANFSEDRFAAALRAWANVDFSVFRYVESGGADGPSILRGGGVYDARFADGDNLTLKFDPDGPRVSQFHGEFAIVNPDSDARALAEDYICALISERESPLNYLGSDAHANERLTARMGNLGINEPRLSLRWAEEIELSRKLASNEIGESAFCAAMNALLRETSAS